MTESVGNGDLTATSRAAKAVDVVSILSTIAPQLPLLLVENDRIVTTATAISANVIAPTIRAKAFPLNVSENLLELMYRLLRVASGSKPVKKDITDAFNDQRFFSFPPKAINDHWLQILQQWCLAEKERMSDLLSRLTAPATAGIMFGVGAVSARLQADRATQLNLRRIALLFLSGIEDAFAPSLPEIQEKLIELISATPASSPSSVTRAEIFMLLRAIVLRTSSLPLAPLWPTINAELTAALSAIVPDDENHDKYNNQSLLMACKLLDTLIALDPDEFQLHEWLYICDTIDVVYRPADAPAIALADAVAEGLADAPTYAPLGGDDEVLDAKPQGGTSLLDTIVRSVQAEMPPDAEGVGADVAGLDRGEFAARVLRPFFGQVGLWAFEERYAMKVVDKQRWVDGLVEDLCGGGVAGGD